MRKFIQSIQVSILIAACSSISHFKNNVDNCQTYLLTSDSVKYWCVPMANSLINPDKEAGMALFKNGTLLDYQDNYQNIRIIYDINSGDIFCEPSIFRVKSDTFFIKRCGWTFVFKIGKLTEDSLELKEITKYGYFPDSIPVNFIRSQDQRTRPVKGELINPDTNTWPVRVLPINK
jgi:hypothetical protein